MEIAANDYREIAYKRKSSQPVIIRVKLSKDRLIKGGGATFDCLKVYVYENSLDSDSFYSHSVNVSDNGLGGIVKSPSVLPLHSSIMGKVFFSCSDDIKVHIKNESSVSQIVEIGFQEGDYIKPFPQVTSFETEEVTPGVLYRAVLPRPDFSRALKIQTLRSFDGLGTIDDGNYRIKISQNIIGGTIANHIVDNKEEIILANNCTFLVLDSSDLAQIISFIAEWDLY